MKWFFVTLFETSTFWFSVRTALDLRAGIKKAKNEISQEKYWDSPGQDLIGFVPPQSRGKLTQRGGEDVL